MNDYVVLLRGINVGGKNKIPMAELRRCLETLGCQNVSTYIQSGNVVLRSSLSPQHLGSAIEAMLTAQFKLDSALIKVLVLTANQLQAVIDNKPPSFGDKPDLYHSDVIFLMDVDAADAMLVFSPREGVDQVWPGDGVIYSQRLSAERTKSRLGKIVGTPVYASMTIRNWRTTTTLLSLVRSSMEETKA